MNYISDFDAWSSVRLSHKHAKVSNELIETHFVTLFSNKFLMGDSDCTKTCWFFQTIQACKYPVHSLQIQI